jgi:hypothetical protein
MIYVRRDVSLIPAKLLAVAARAQARLEGLAESERAEFIKKKAHIWRNFGRHLAQMSYGKCWYSESPDPQSFFDVDHFRPKLEARRSEQDVDRPGYEWLAFSWDNFRYAANCSNRVSQNLETGAVEGKGSWFPLLEGSAKASWEERRLSDERPTLLDPAVKSDVDLVDVAADGRIVPARLAVGSSKIRVTRSCELYGLNLPRIKAARLRLMREVNEMAAVLSQMLESANRADTTVPLADSLPVMQQREAILLKTTPESPYSRAARAALVRAGWAELCA